MIGEPETYKTQVEKIYFGPFIMQKRINIIIKKVITVFLLILQHDKDIEDLRSKVSTMKSPAPHEYRQAPV